MSLDMLDCSTIPMITLPPLDFHARLQAPPSKAWLGPSGPYAAPPCNITWELQKSSNSDTWVLKILVKNGRVKPPPICAVSSQNWVMIIHSGWKNMWMDHRIEMAVHHLSIRQSYKLIFLLLLLFWHFFCKTLSFKDCDGVSTSDWTDGLKNLLPRMPIRDLCGNDQESVTCLSSIWPCGGKNRSWQKKLPCENHREEKWAVFGSVKLVSKSINRLKNV